jgi:hypothetical protein
MSKAYLMAELPEHEPRTSQRCALVSVFDSLPSPTFVSLHWTYRAPQTLSPLKWRRVRRLLRFAGRTRNMSRLMEMGDHVLHG